MARLFTCGVASGLIACAVIWGCSDDGPAVAPLPPSQGEQDAGIEPADTAPPPPDGCFPNPANFDIPGNGCDDDADGTIDNTPTCDDALRVNGSAEEFAKALGICKMAMNGHGVLYAQYTQGYGVSAAPATDQHGVVDKFGDVIKPREGKRLGILSTGFAEEYNGHVGKAFGGGDSMEWEKNGVANLGKAPPGYPKATQGCSVATDIHDVINLKLTLKAPANATGFKFDFNFHTGEWPSFVCSSFNDAFVAFLSAKGFNGGKPENMSFDPNNNTFSVNSAFFDRCTPNTPTGCFGAVQRPSLCPGGPGELAGTGFGIQGTFCADAGTSTSGGATGWLSSRAPISPGETFILELMVWDTGDSIQDSLVLLDNFQWLSGPVTVGTVRP